MVDKKRNSKREKGAAPPDYIPAIFGWMTMDDQVEHAREIAAFIEKTDEQKQKDQSSTKNTSS